MLTVEVLVSMLILFMVVATSVVTLKQLKIILLQQIRHEELYIEVFNIKEMIDGGLCKNFLEKNGFVNGYEYKAVCMKIAQKRSYIKDYEEGIDGNEGSAVVRLYKVNLTLKKEGFEKNYSYFKSVVQAVR